jgi:hypothetical protein
LERINEETDEEWRINENTLGEENPTRVWRNPREGERNHLEIQRIQWGSLQIALESPWSHQEMMWRRIWRLGFEGV